MPGSCLARRRAPCPEAIPSRRRCDRKAGVCSQLGWAARRRPRHQSDPGAGGYRWRREAGVLLAARCGFGGTVGETPVRQRRQGSTGGCTERHVQLVAPSLGHAGLVAASVEEEQPHRNGRVGDDAEVSEALIAGPAPGRDARRSSDSSSGRQLLTASAPH
jgi:hypothetical protein